MWQPAFHGGQLLQSSGQGVLASHHCCLPVKRLGAGWLRWVWRRHIGRLLPCAPLLRLCLLLLLLLLRRRLCLLRLLLLLLVVGWPGMACA